MIFIVLAQEDNILTNLVHGVKDLGQLDSIQVLQSTRPETEYTGKSWRVRSSSQNVQIKHADPKSPQQLVFRVNSRLQEAHELLTLLLGLVGDDGPVGLALHAPQTHHRLCCDVSDTVVSKENDWLVLD